MMLCAGHKSASLLVEEAAGRKAQLAAGLHGWKEPGLEGALLIAELAVVLCCTVPLHCKCPACSMAVQGSRVASPIGLCQLPGLSCSPAAEAFQLWKEAPEFPLLNVGQNRTLNQHLHHSKQIFFCMGFAWRCWIAVSSCAVGSTNTDGSSALSVPGRQCLNRQSAAV